MGPQKIQKSKVLKIKIRSAQIVGEIFLCRKKASPPHLGPSRPIFSVGRKNPKIAQFLPIFLGGPLGPIHPGWDPCCTALADSKPHTSPTHTTPTPHHQPHPHHTHPHPHPTHTPHSYRHLPGVRYTFLLPQAARSRRDVSFCTKRRDLDLPVISPTASGETDRYGSVLKLLNFWIPGLAYLTK